MIAMKISSMKLNFKVAFCIQDSIKLFERSIVAKNNQIQLREYDPYCDMLEHHDGIV